MIAIGELNPGSAPTKIPKAVPMKTSTKLIGSATVANP